MRCRTTEIRAYRGLLIGLSDGLTPSDYSCRWLRILWNKNDVVEESKFERPGPGISLSCELPDLRGKCGAIETACRR